MAKILTKEDVLNNQDFFIEAIKNGKVFLYPTDTLYGLGGNACLADCVAKINKIKQRSNKPLLVIAPNLGWVNDNCQATPEIMDEILAKWPGAYSFIFKLKNLAAVDAAVLGGQDTIGVRYPDHWFGKIIARAGVPFISTSANLAGETPAKTFAHINSLLLEQVDYAINDDAGISGQASELIDVSSGVFKSILR
jgi:L-threonylcarbamoyladenylate synthase